MVRFAGLVLVQRVQLWVGLIAKGLTGHGGEVKMEAVQQEVDFDPGPPGLWTHGRRGTGEQRGAVHRAEGLVLRGAETGFRT